MLFGIAIHGFSATAPALLNHRDVENVENAWSSFLPTSCIRAVVDSGTNLSGTDLHLSEGLRAG